MVCTKALGQEGAEQEEKRRPGCQKSQSDWKRGLRLEGSTEKPKEDFKQGSDMIILEFYGVFPHQGLPFSL